MAVVFKNNAKTTLASGINSSVTSISVSAGSLLPSLTGSDFFFATIDDGTKNEIVKVTARSSNTLTVVRAQDNTTAQSFSTGAVVELRLTAAILELFSQTGVAITDEIEAYLDANGLTFPDDTQAKFGTDNDLTIDHNSSTGNSRIIDNSGILNIQQSSDDGQIRFQCDDGSGGVTTYYQISGAGETNTFFKDIKLGDNVKALFGTSNDFQIYHSSFDTYLSNSTGHLVLQNQANDKDIVLQTDNGSGGTADYLRLVGAHTRMLASQHIRIADTKQLQLGDDNDFSANFNGNHTFLTNNTGILYLTQNVDDGVIRIRNDDGSGGVTDYINLHGGTGEVRLSHYGTVKLKTITNGVDVPSGGLFVGGTEVITSARNLTNIGTISSGAITTSNILTVDYTAPIIRLKPDNGAFFQLRANESPARLEVGHSSNTNLHLSNTGNATFNFDLNVVSNFKINGTTVIDSSRNLTNIGTISSGAITSSGNVTFNGGFNKFTGDVEIEHNPLILDTNPGSTYGVSEALRIDDTGATTDRQLQIYELLHSGGRSHRIAFNTQITTDGSSAYTYTQGNYGGSSQIEFANNGGLIFYTVNQQSGGSATAITPIERFRINEDGDVRFESGNVFYDASQNALNFIDNVPAQFGAANDLQILHNGTDSAINNVTGDLYITNKADDKDILFRSDDGSGGFTTYFKVDGSEVRTEFAKDTRHTDNVKAMFGGGNDLQIYHNGSNSYIDDTGTGNLFIRSNEIRLNKYTGEFMIRAIADGAVTLYHDNSAKIATTSTGIDVTGTVTATTFSGALSGTIASATTATTQSAGDNSTKVATTAYTDTAIANLADSAPSTLNTLNELAAALGDDANFSTTVTNSIATKLPLAGGTMTGALNMGSQNITNAGTISSGAITSTGASSGRYTGLEVVNSTNAGGTETAIGLGVVSASNTACDVKLVANRVGANSGSDFYIEQTDSSGSQQETFRITESGNATFAGEIFLGNQKEINFAKADGTNDGTKIERFGGNALRFRYAGNAAIFDDLDNNGFHIRNGGDIEVFRVIPNASVGSSTTDIVNGSLRMGSTTIIDASRNLTNIGTISSSNITATGSGAVASFNRTDNDAIIELKRSGSIKGFIGANTSGDIKFFNNTAATTLTIDSSGNLTNIGTISSGAITSSGRVTGTEVRVTNVVTNKVIKFDGTVLNDSNITDTGSLITLGSNTNMDGRLTLTSGTTSTIAGTAYLNINANVGGVNTNGSHGLHIGWNKSNGGREINMIFDGGTSQADTEMIFTSTDGTTYTDIFQINGAVGTGVDIKSGGLRIGTTTVIDSSRNLTNIGTISSGAITSTGNITTDWNDTISMNYAPSLGSYHKGMSGTSFASGNTARGLHLFNFDNDSNLGINFWVGTTASKVFAARIDSSGKFGLGIDSPQAPLSFANSVGNKIDFYHTTSGSGDRYGIQVQSSELRIHSGNLGSSSGGITFGKSTTSSFVENVRFTNAGDIQMGATPVTVIDSSRNLTNIGTISSGAITSTGNSQFTGSGSSGNAFSVRRGSDSGSTLRVLNSGEVIVDNNYLYASHTGTAFYVQGGAVFRGGISNDTSGQPVTFNDDISVSGGFDATSAGSIPSIRGGGSYGGGIGFVDTNVSGMYTDGSGANLRLFTNQSGSDRADAKIGLSIDGSQRVGIGTTAPTHPLHILGTSNDTIDETKGNLKVQGGGGNGLIFGTIASSPYSSYIQSAYVQDTSLARYNLVLNPIGGNIGIGTTTTRQKLHQHINNSGANYHLFTNTTTGTGTTDGLVVGISGDEDALIWNHENENMLFATNNTERMRIDSSGNLLVGTSQNNPTSSSVNVAGQEFSTTGGVRSTVASNPSATFNRKTDDGEIVLFRKDGTTIGAIGSISSDLFIAESNVGLRFDGENNQILPCSTTASTNGTCNLGASSNAFADLHLSGTISSGAITSSGVIKGTAYKPYSSTSAISYHGYANRDLITAVDGAAYYYGSDGGAYGIVIQGGHPICKSVKIGSVNAGTTVIDSSRNLTNIGTYSGTGNMTVAKSTTPIVVFETTATAGQDATLKIRGARTSSNSADIASIFFDNKTSSAYTLAKIIARDPSANHSLGNGQLKLQTSSGGTLSDALVLDNSQNATFAGTISSGAITSSGVITVNNVGSDKKISFNRTGGKNISIEHDANQIYFWNNTDGHFLMKMSNAGLVQSKVGFSVNGTTVIDSSRNLTNIGTISSGNINVGVSDTTNGTITIHGGASGNAEGGEIRLQTSADHDGTYDFYRVDVNQDDFRIGREGTTDFYIFQDGLVKAENNFQAGGTGNFGNLEVSGTQVISSARNIENVGTVTTSGKLNVGNAAINGRDMLLIKTSANTVDRGLSFQNSGTAYSNSIFAEDVGGNDARLVFTGGNASGTITALSRDFMINNQSGGGGVSGDIHARGDVVAFSSTISSDARLKYDIKDIENPLEILQSLKGRHFKWKKNDQQSSGVIAQEVEQSDMAFLVSDKVDIENPDETIKRVKYDGFIGLLIEAIKDQQDQIEYMKSEIKVLKEANNGDK